MKHVEYKIFTIFNHEAEEKWLNEKAAKGEFLTDVGFCRYVFEDDEPGKYVYRLEMLDEFPNHYKSVEYLKFLEETGIEHVASILKWVYLRKKSSEGAFDIYSDIESRIIHYKRIINLANILIFIQLIVGIPNLILNLTLSHGSSIYLINLIIAILFFIGNKSLKEKVSKLEKEKLYRE